MESPGVTRLWSGEKDWSRPSLCIVDNPTFDFERWYGKVGKTESERNVAITKTLGHIKKSMEHFNRNIRDGFCGGRSHQKQECITRSLVASPTFGNRAIHTFIHELLSLGRIPGF